MKKYDGKNAWWLILIIVIYNLLPLCIFVSGDVSPLSHRWSIILWIVYYGCNLIWIPIIVRNRVELFDDYFMFYYGFINIRIEVKDIVKIEKNRSFIASSANSLDKIFVVTKKKDVCFALKQNDTFIEELNRIKNSTRN